MKLSKPEESDNLIKTILPDQNFFAFNKLDRKANDYNLKYLLELSEVGRLID